MLFIVALLLAASLSFATDWVDVAVKHKLVESSGDSYYEISSAKELAWFSKEVASGKTGINAVLKNDIVLWNPASGDTNYWNPIGPSDSLAFEGTFEGLQDEVLVEIVEVALCRLSQAHAHCPAEGVLLGGEGCFLGFVAAAGK